MLEIEGKIKMVSLIWHMMMMVLMMIVCEKEVCLLCAGVLFECEGLIERKVVGEISERERERRGGERN